MINNMAQLNLILGGAVAEALENTTKILLEELRRIIDQDIYSYNATWTNGYDDVLGRTGQFKDSWIMEMSPLIGTYVQSQIFQDYDAMDYDSPFSHGSEYSGGKLKPNGLADIIENGLAPAFHGFPEGHARPFWSNFENYVNANVQRIFAEECKKLGLPISFIGATFS